MELINPFELVPRGAFLYFNYGLAFIFLGVVIFSKDMKGSRLKIAAPLKYLAIFGFFHGSLEWFELLGNVQGPLMSQSQILMLKLLGLLLGVISYFFLILFGSNLLKQISSKGQKHWLYVFQIAVVVTWACLVMYKVMTHKENYFSLLYGLDKITRYILAFSGSYLAGTALLLYSSKVKEKSQSASFNFFQAGVAFLVYGVLAGVIPSKSLIPLVGIPVEFFRMTAAVLITLFIVRGLNIFDLETRRVVREQTKQLDQAEKLASLGRLAAGVAHEINNPLTNASLNVQMVKKRIDRIDISDESISDKINAIGRNIDRASIIAKELLQFSRNDTDVFSRIDVNSVIKNAINTLDYKLDNIRVSLKCSDIPKIMGSSGKLQQVFINILHNSYEAIGGKGEIEIISEVAGENILVSIFDNGAGISQEKLDQLFDPFFTTKEIGQGTGLGLFICYGIIQQHNGNINIKSKTGWGTRVEIALPVSQEKYEEDINH